MRSPVRAVRLGDPGDPYDRRRSRGGLSPERPDHARGVVSQPTALLEVRDLVTRYPIPRGVVGALTRAPKRTVHAVEGVSFSVGRGEMLALVGESGCGKTSTAQTVMRLVEPAGGSIRFHGRDITRLGHHDLRPLRRKMQMIYQDPYESLNPR